MLSGRFAANVSLLNRLEGDLSCGRFPSAVMLTGESGSGKTALAKLLAAGLVCTGESKPCGACRDCRKALADAHPDIQFFARPADGNSFRKEDVDRLREQVYMAPNEAQNKVFILDGAADLTQSAANSLLKVLEEPPEHTYLILTTRNRRDVLPTVRSRVVEFALTLPQPTEAAPFIAGLAQTDEASALAAAERFGGNVGRAVRMLTSPEEREIADWVDRVIDGQRKGDVFGLTQTLLSAGTSDRRLCRERLSRLYEQYCRMTAQSGDDRGLPARALLNGCDAVRQADDYLGANASVTAVLLWLAAELKR